MSVPAETWAQNQPAQHYEAAFLAQGRYPSGAAELDWFPDDHEMQGVANDGQNWFFTMVDQEGTRGSLWRIPKSVPLNGNVSSYAGVAHVSSLDVPELAGQSYWHWGDPDHMRYQGVDYILVPIFTIVVCFRAEDLHYVNYAHLDDRVYAGWCAVGVDSALYVSANSPNSIACYRVDWPRLLFTPFHDAVSYRQSYALSRADGSPLTMTDMQGGEFSPSGEMLYLVSGRGYCLLNGAPWTPSDGIHAIETHGWSEVAQSVKASGDDIPFSYDYDPTCIECLLYVGFGGTDTPEGVTVWDLDDGSAPNMRGLVHVLVDRWMLSGVCPDEFSLHHFSAKLFVDASASGAGEGLSGRQDHPFQTLGDVYAAYPIWNGAEVVLKAGVYRDTGVYDKRVRLTCVDGPAIIGRQ